MTDPALTPEHRQRWGGVLRQWAHRDTEIGREIRGREIRWRRDRRRRYLEQAHALCARYRVLILEDIDLRQLAQVTEDTDPVLKAANTYRQLAALSVWRHGLQIVAPKYDTQLVRCPAAGTTNTCAVCGAPVEQTGEIVLWCANGHGMDTDENAGRRLRDGYLA
jgi:transposase